MKIPALLLLCLAAGLRLVSAQPAYPLLASPLELVTDEAKFREFAAEVAADLDRRFAEPAMIDGPALKVLLSSRVHLAHHLGDEAKAVATAAWIRSLQADPVEKSFAGLTTFAAVAARHAAPGAAAGDPAYRAAFLREFSARLGELPRTPAVAAMLRRQREKIAGVTLEILLAEVREKIAPAIGGRKTCTLDEADQLIRVRHRLVSIVPVRAETLQALDAAIAARSAP